jgi:hypothetical protein
MPKMVINPIFFSISPQIIFLRFKIQIFRIEGHSLNEIPERNSIGKITGEIGAGID